MATAFHHTRSGVGGGLSDYRAVLHLARSHHHAAPRPPGWLINYGLSTRNAQALIRGGWSTIADLDTTERAWRTAINHEDIGELHTWLQVPGLGVAGANDLRDSLARWRDDRPADPARSTRIVQVAAAVRADIAAGAIEHGQTMPSTVAVARRHNVQHDDVTKAYDVLVLAGWCAWRNQPHPRTWRDHRLPVALLPGPPCRVTWPTGSTARARRRAADAVELLRHNPGVWQPSHDNPHTLRALASIADVEFNDAERTLAIKTVSTRAPEPWPSSPRAPRPVR
jgi:hypothetical protein